MTVEFDIAGQKFVALNGGPHFQINEAVSFIIHCQTQAEIDYYWKRLSARGESGQCGWLKDKFGVSWQVVPAILGNWMAGDAATAERVMAALLKMGKLDIQKLKQAAQPPRRARRRSAR